MSFLDTIKSCGSLGIKLSAKDDKLVINDTRKQITPELLQQLKQHKLEILEWLQRDQLENRPIPRFGATRAPLSFAQQRLWLIDQLEGATPQYNIPLALRLRGRLDLNALRRALDAIVERHEVLRSVFAAEGEGAVQIVVPAQPVAVSEVDLSHCADDVQQTQVRRLAADEALRAFDLARDAMLRCAVLRLREDDHVALFTVHHIAADGTSTGVLVREFVEAYAAAVEDRAAQLPELAIQYGDYARWQRQTLRGAVLDKELAFWRERLAGIPAVHALPLDRARPERQSFRAAHHEQKLDAALLKSLHKLAQTQGATLFMLLQAAFAVVLARWSGEDDIVIGVPHGGRERKELEPLIGFFINTLVFRTRVDLAQPFAELLAVAQQQAVDAYAHQGVPFETLVDELKPDRSLSYNPLCQIKFVLQNYEAGQLDIPGLAISPVDSGVSSIRFDLDLSVGEGADALHLNWGYKQELFDEATIARLARSYALTLQTLVADPQTRIGDLPLLDAAQRAELVEMGQGEAVAEGREVCLADAIRAASVLHADAIAVRDASGRAITHAQLDAQSNRLAHYLIEQGVGAGQFVGIVVERSVELIIGLLAIQKTGAAYVPLDARQGKARVAEILSDAQIDWVLASSAKGGELPVGGIDLVFTDGIADASDWLADYPASAPEVVLKGDDAVYAIYTSGSTGKPKGVLIKQSGLMDYCAFARQYYYADALDGSLVVTSAAFDLTVPSLYVPLLVGGCVELLADEGELEGLAATLAAGEKNYLLRMTPGQVQGLLALLPSDARVEQSHHVFVIGGEAFTPALATQLQQRFASSTIYNHYGPTETVVGCALHRVDIERDAALLRLPIGRAMHNTRLYVLDAARQPVPVGVAGELHIGGAGVAIGYLHREDLTAEKFVTDPFVENERVYRTGDLVRWRADGELEFLGRADDQVKLRGFRIELGEIESRLRQLEGVSEAVVRVRGEDDAQQLVAYVVPQGNTAADWSDTLRSALQSQLPDYMVPTAWCVLDQLPRTPNGKLDNRALPEPGKAAADAYVEPATSTEQAVAELWGALLKRELVSATANFFALGGNSLLATRVVSAVAERLHKRVAVRSVFEHATVRAFAKHIDEQATTIHKPIPVVARDTDLPLSFAQQRLWFIDELEGGTPQYNMPTALRLRGPLDLAALQSALDRVVARHEILRTTYLQRDGQALQRIHAAGSVPIRRLQASGEGAAHEAQIRELIAQEVWKPFDLSRDLMLRVTLIDVAEQERIILFTMHHIASDGWSNGIVIREFVAYYSEHAFAQPAALAPLALQYADFAHWQRDTLKGDELQRQLGYWRERLTGMPAVHALPLDRPRPAQQRFTARTQRRVLDSVLLDGLNALARRSDATLFMVLQSAFAALLARWSGENDIVMGVPHHGRERKELEPLIGFFINTLVFRSEIDTAQSFRELLVESRRHTLQAYAHQGIPFEALVEELKPERSLAYNPLCQIKFSLQNYDAESLSIPGLEISPAESDATTIRFELDLSISEDARGLALNWTWKEDLFEPATIARLSDAFATLLAAIVADADQRIDALPLLDAASTDALTALGHGDDVTLGRDAALSARIAMAAAATPQAVAVRDAHGQQLTHAQLDALANRLAHELRACGHGVGSRIGVVAERCAELLVALLAVQRSGAAYLPMDPRLGAVRCGEILTDAGVSLLLCPGSAGEALAPEGVDRLSLADALSEADWLAQHPATAPDIACDAQAPVYVIYTSGSTGKPKGVVIPQRGLVDYCAFAEQHYYGAALAGSLVLTSPAFDLTVPSLYVPLLRGGCVDLLPDDGEVEALAQRLVDDGDARLLRMTPGHVQGLLALLSGRAPLLQPHVFVVGGEAFPVVLAQALQAQFPAATIYNHYGPTETVVGCCLHRFDAARAASYDRLPIGRPMHNTQLYVLDAQQRLLPQGMVGELCIGGAGVALGYLDRAELTAEKFIADPFAAGTTLYRSGDRVRWRHDGELEFVGRADDQVKLRGFRIELGEIEQRLRCIAGIADAAVIVRGEGTSARLCAYLAGSGDVVATTREALQQQLPDYMVPASWNVLVELPRTRNGKLDRRALPEPELVTPEAAYAAPRNAIEETLCRIWAGLLRVERVGIYDNFFAIGGDSILSIQAVARANQAGIRINTRQVFKHQTVAALAAQATQAGEIEQPQQAVVGELDLLPAQRRFFALGATDAHHYNQCVLLRAPADFDAAALAPVARALFERHDGLRLVFAQDGEHWQARHRELDDAVLAAAVVSETAPAGVDVHEWVTARCAHWQQRFDLANGPLLRLIHLDVPGDARLFVLAHHLIVDGISWRLLLADIESAYAQWRQGTAIALAAKTTSLQQWSRALAAQATSATLAAERSYWLAQLALPHESLREAASAQVGDAHAPISFVLGSDETEALLRRCATQFGAPVSELLLAALYVAVRRWSGVNYLRVALESHGREPFDDAFDVSETLGWFTTIHPLTLHADDAHPITALKAVKQQYRAIPRHGIGYAVLRHLAGDAAFAEQAAAQEPELLFNYLGQFDQVVSNESTFALAPEGMGEPVSARRALRPDGQVLACNCIVSQGKLHAGFKFDERVLSRGAIAQLTEAFAASLRELVALSAQPSVHAWTTADFPLARIDQRELDRFVASHPDLLRLYPATPMQQGMLFHSWLDKTAYLSQRFPQINGALDTQAFRRAWQTVIDRHDAFRTAFVGKEGEIHQLVLARAELPWHEEDWRGLSAEEQNQRFAEYRRADQQRGFELSPPPLTRVALFRLADERYQLLWTNHHALTDGWSSPLVFRDMVETYRALVEQRTPKLAQPPVYERYIEWLQRQDAARARDWWRELLADVDAPTALPLDIAGEHRGEGYAMRHLPLGAELARTLQALARRHRTTVNTVLQLAWGYLLHRHSNDARVVFGSTVSGRPAEVPGVEDMVGLFINTLPVRVAFDREARIATLIERLQDEFQRSNEHGFLALPEIQQQSQVPAGTPLFDSVIVFENYPVEPSLDDNGRSGGASKSSDLHTNFRLTLVASLAEEFDLHCSYALNDYGAETIDRLLAQLADVLRQLAGGCERLEDLRIDGADRAAIDGWNATAREWPQHVRVQALFEAQARARPDALAVADAHERLSYAELDARANRVAQWLRGQGAGRDSVVAVCTDRSVQMLVGLLGALKADAAYVPLDPEYPADRLRYMLEDSGARQLVTLSSLRDRLPLGERAVLCLDDSTTLECWPAEAPAAIDARRSDDLAYVIYTSGSTGQPKGVLLAHGGALNLALNQQALFDVGQNSRVAQFASLSFDAATWDWLMALSHGASLHVCSAAERQSPALLADWLVRERITHATLPPALLPHLELERDYALDALIVAGEACEPQTAWRWAARVPLYNAYGPTEATVCASVARVVPDERITIGAPLANVRLYVLDAQGREQPVGAAGELHIAGEGLARGYRGREDLTNAAFVASARDAGERLYRSGDLARWLPDGRIEFLGRRDDQVKIRGFRIELGEIESALLQLREPRLREAAVIAAPTAQGAQLVAFIVAESGETNDETAFITAVGDALAQRLPQHLLPTRYVKLDQLPLTASGKVDRKALRVPDANAASAAFVAPSTETERALAQIWSHLLSVPVEQIGTQATFFELGGNSLAMIRLQSAIRQHLGVEVSAPKLFERPTLARLAELIDGFRLVSGTAAARAAEGAAKPAASDDMIEETF